MEKTHGTNVSIKPPVMDKDHVGPWASDKSVTTTSNALVALVNPPPAPAKPWFVGMESSVKEKRVTMAIPTLMMSASNVITLFVETAFCIKPMRHAMTAHSIQININEPLIVTPRARVWPPIAATTIPTGRKSVMTEII